MYSLWDTVNLTWVHIPAEDTEYPNRRPGQPPMMLAPRIGSAKKKKNETVKILRDGKCILHTTSRNKQQRQRVSFRGFYNNTPDAFSYAIRVLTYTKDNDDDCDELRRIQQLYTVIRNKKDDVNV